MKNKQGPGNRFRIIGGSWRSRNVSFANVEAIRPTADRVRETLFNWLQFDIVGAQCLDLFCGSGALSFEALSRGAGSVIALERDPVACKAIQTSARTLGADSLQLLNRDTLEYLAHNDTGRRFDIIFLDPPFQEHMLEQLLQLLVKHHWLHDRSLVYLESGEALEKIVLPPLLGITRSKKAGQVYFGLCTVHGHD